MRAELRGGRGGVGAQRGHAVQAVDDMKLGFAGLGARHAAEHRVARAHMRIHAREIFLRLDDDPAPAGEIEPAGHVVGDRMAAADIDVETGRLFPQRPPEHVVFEILRVGQIHRASLVQVVRGTETFGRYGAAQARF